MQRENECEGPRHSDTVNVTRSRVLEAPSVLDDGSAELIEDNNNGSGLGGGGQSPPRKKQYTYEQTMDSIIRELDDLVFALDDIS